MIVTDLWSELCDHIACVQGNIEKKFVMASALLSFDFIEKG